MASEVVGIVGSYRKGKTVDSAVAAVLEGASEAGAETRLFHLVEQDMGFCTNCRSCMQKPDVSPRGRCVQDDAMGPILDAVDRAGAVVFGAPINMGSTSAIMKRFVERLAPYSFWPWGEARAPAYRIRRPDKRAALVWSAATPALLRRVMLSGAADPLERAARSVGAKVTTSLYFGGVCPDRDACLSDADLDRARRAGRELAS